MLRRRNDRVAFICVAVVAGMVGLSYASVPLYRLFCQVTGYGGTTQVATAVPDQVLDRDMTVRFDSNVAGNLPWEFKPVQVSQTIKVGERGLAFYQVRNTSGRPVTGTASFNVTPQKAGVYFSKIECFCFTEQTLKPGQTMNMPVSYFLDPALAEDRRMEDVKTITLSYTFYRTDTPEQQTAEAKF